MTNHSVSTWPHLVVVSQVRITDEGLIQVGSEGDDLPFMHWQDPEPLMVEYFSFSTWERVAGTWIYDCKETDNDIGTVLKVI